MDRKLTYDRLREVLEYNPDTGEWRWLRRMSQRVRAGDLAGSICLQGNGKYYRTIGIDRKIYRSPVLAWFYMTREWPTVDVDHKDPNSTTDDRWVNLRLATRQQNVWNTNIRTNNKSGFKGVVFVPRISKYVAKIRINGRSVHLGVFRTAEQAHAAYCVKAKEIHGEFFNAG